jgi:DNA repair exonuclease SbcCD ATPase subunit
MMTRLRTLQFLPSAINGWTSGPFVFSDTTTLINGANGAGKTPVVRSIVFALGFPISLPPEMERRCRAIALTIESDGKEYVIERTIGTAFEISVQIQDSHPEKFTDEKTFANWMLPVLGLALRNFAGLNGNVSAPYISFLLPLCYVDQDLSWRDTYTPLSTHAFLKDQKEEVTRWMLSVSSKNTPASKEEFQHAKIRLESAQEQVKIKRATLEALAIGVDGKPLTDHRADLEKRHSFLAEELKRQSSALERLAKSDTSYDEEISRLAATRDRAAFALQATERRATELREIGSELNGELKILEMNETAADAFRVLCGNNACGFFRNPEESYGRRLLFLKDQLKDIGTSGSIIASDVARLRSALDLAASDLAKAMNAKEKLLQDVGGEDVVAAIDALSTDLARVQAEVFRVERIEAERALLEKLIDAVAKWESEVKRLRPSRGAERDNTRLWDVQQTFAKFIKSWLDTLAAQNLSADVLVDDRLRVVLDGIPFDENSHHSGSTRTRIVLAYRAALIETALELGGNIFPFLILDTPKQQEINTSDLRAFVDRFEKLSSSSATSIQLIIASKTSDYVSRPTHTWLPTVLPDGTTRFFRPVN